ncbi:MAG TPA: hypothetical protein VGD81_12225 [Opitutaceae bacterium]
MLLFQRLLLACAVFFTLSGTGCFWRKSQPKPPIATEVEEGFKERWVAKRVGELIASGGAANGLEARRIALQEFKERYEYTRAAEQIGNSR